MNENKNAIVSEFAYHTVQSLKKKKKRKGELWFPKIKNFQSKLKTIQTIKKKSSEQ